jgi:hypothetical protein
MKLKNFKCSRKFIKQFTAMFMVALMIVVLTLTVYAAAGNTALLRTNVQTALITIVTIVGGGFTLIGAIALIQSQSSNDENQKSQGVKQLAVGLALIIVGNGLVAGFMAMWPA